MERILIVDDAESVRTALRLTLEDEGFETFPAANGAEAVEHLRRRRLDLVVLDLFLPDRDGLELLAELHHEHPELPIVVVSGQGTIDVAIQATRLGAYDFLEKPLASSRLLVTVHNALERTRMSRRLEALSRQVERRWELIGESAPMRRLRSELQRAGASDARILLMGENGSGKELAARLAHRLSPRALCPFVEVNCAAIPEELIESELFGHVRGAFTGAGGDRAGRFEQAHGGTLFLDEIGDMSLKTQAKVLRALQEQRFERVGGHATIQVDVRLIAATNKVLEDEIRHGRFREDLYFRLAVIPIEVPPLRERRGDVPELIEYFLAHYARELGRRPKRLSPEAMARLEDHAWPGNVRELRNLVERLVIMVEGDEIGVRDLPAPLRGDAGQADPAPVDTGDGTLRAARAAFEKHFIAAKLRGVDGNVTRAAELLGLERSHLYRKLRAYGLEVERD
jgi:two-component system nitrogen regulation response regulator NtrX